jgi:AcrR family transcriptional regulator
VVYLKIVQSDSSFTWPESAGQDPSATARQGAFPDRRARRREEGRNRVYETAVELFVASGFDATTMDEIADHADVARATVFNYFQRKTAFLDEWAARRRQYAATAVRAEHLDDHPLPEILRRYMVELAQLSTRTRAETVSLMGAAIHSTNVLGNPELGHELAEFIARAQAVGEIRPGIDAELAGLLLATGYFAILSQWIASEPAPFDLESRLLNMVDLQYAGLR